MFDPNDKDPYVQTWNFGIEHRIEDWLLETTYVGKAGVHIGTRVGVNNPVPSTLPNPQSREPYPLFGSRPGCRRCRPFSPDYAHASGQGSRCNPPSQTP